MAISDNQKYAAELLGTFALVFIGCGSAVIAGPGAAMITGADDVLIKGPDIGFVGISFAFGLTVLAMAFAIGGISGCHINPAISIAMLVGGKMKAKDTVGYIIAQCIGAVVAALVLYLIATGNENYDLDVNGLGQNGYGDHSPAKYVMEACFLAEVVLTALFLLVIFGSTSKFAPPGFAGIPIGFSLVLIHLIGIPVTGVSVNPARSLGPAVIVGGDALNQLWLFWIAPIIGGVIAAVVWRFVFEEESAPKPAAPAPKKMERKEEEDDDEDEEEDEEEEEDEDDDEDEEDEEEAPRGKGKK